MQSPASSSLMPNGNGWRRYCRASRPPPGRLGFNNRKTVEGILGIAGAGAPWRGWPPYFGQGNAIHQRFRRWVKSGVFARLLNARQAALALPGVMGAGPFVEVHPPGAGPKRGPFPRGKPASPSRRPEPGRMDHQAAGFARKQGPKDPAPVKAGECR